MTLCLLRDSCGPCPLYDYIWSWLRWVCFHGFYEEQKERAGRNLSLLQGALEYTLGDIPFGRKAALG